MKAAVVSSFGTAPRYEDFADPVPAGPGEMVVDVIAAGLGSTDMLYYGSGDLGLPGAMVTASHNPPQYNDIKLCRAGAKPVGIETGLKDIKDLAERSLVHDFRIRALASGVVAGALALAANIPAQCRRRVAEWIPTPRIPLSMRPGAADAESKPQPE